MMVILISDDFPLLPRPFRKDMPGRLQGRLAVNMYELELR